MNNLASGFRVLLKPEHDIGSMIFIIRIDVAQMGPMVNIFDRVTYTCREIGYSKHAFGCINGFDYKLG